MSEAKLDGWRCDRPECGHVWYTGKAEKPSACARCKSKAWDKTRTPPTAKAKPEEIARTPFDGHPAFDAVTDDSIREAMKPPRAPAPRQRLEIDPTLPDYIEEPAKAPPPIATARSIHTGSYQRPEHDASTCKVYGCGMCKVAKRT